MAEFVLSGILTTAGAAAANAAKTGTKLSITKLVLGSATAAVTAATTSIGTTLLETTNHSIGFNLGGNRTDFFFFFEALPNRNGGTVGIYSGNILLAAARFTPSAEDYIEHVTLRVNGLTSESFAAQKSKAIIPASLVGDAFAYNTTKEKKYQTVTQKHDAVLGTLSGQNISTYLLNNQLPILGTAAEVAAYQATNNANAYFDLRDWKQYRLTDGAYVATDATLTVNKGLFYFSNLNNSLYYARDNTDLILLSKF